MALKASLLTPFEPVARVLSENPGGRGEVIRQQEIGTSLTAMPNKTGAKVYYAKRRGELSRG